MLVNVIVWLDYKFFKIDEKIDIENKKLLKVMVLYSIKSVY